MSDLTPRDRLIGGLIGVLVGDALGVPVEFTGRTARDHDPVTGMRGFGTWNQPAGTWSDDSSMTLVNADALVTHGWDLQQVMSGQLAWLDQGAWTPHGAVFDIGNRTRNSLMLFRMNSELANCGNSGAGLFRLRPTALSWATRQP